MSTRGSRPRKINRAQRRAAQVRAAESQARPHIAEDAITEPIGDERPQRRTGERGRIARRRQTSAQPIAARTERIPRQAEMAYIASDFRRLMITSGAIFAVMVALLFVLQ